MANNDAKIVLDFHWVRNYAGRIVARVDIETTPNGAVNVYVNEVRHNKDGRLVAHKPLGYMLGSNTLVYRLKKEVLIDNS